MRASTLALALCAFTCTPVSDACPFMNHKARRLQTGYNPPVTVKDWDETETGFDVTTLMTTAGPYHDATKADTKEWCYWSMQTLYLPPQNWDATKDYGTCTGTAGCTFGDPKTRVLSPQDAEDMWNLAEQAVDRWNKLGKSGQTSVVFGSVAYGRNMWEAFCKLPADKGPSAAVRTERCGVLGGDANTWIHPLSTVIVKLNGPNSDKLAATVTEWRNQATGHVPAMTSELVTKRGYGFSDSEGMFAKVVPCSEIPSEYMTPRDFTAGDGAEPLDPKDKTKPLFMRKLKEWGDLCSVTADDPDRAKCLEKKAAAAAVTTAAPTTTTKVATTTAKATTSTKSAATNTDTKKDAASGAVGVAVSAAVVCAVAGVLSAVV